jgi:hypothetical protein
VEGAIERWTLLFSPVLPRRCRAPAIGLQLVARPFEESLMLTAAQAYEQATSWHTRRPALMPISGGQAG